MNIQWFPGHMVKTRRLISENLKLVDAVCEIIDARIPVSSRNPDLDSLTENKPRLVIMNKIDLADPNMTRKWVTHIKDSGMSVLETDCKSGYGMKHIHKTVNSLLADKIAANNAKGQTGKKLRLMVVGIPNAGKSSFINRAAKRKATETADKPGVTRIKQWINIDRNIDLLDTPGVLWPKFEDQVIAENLAFTGAIRDETMDIETLGARLMLRLAELYPQTIMERYKLNTKETPDDTGFLLLAGAAKKRGYIISGGEYDMQRMAVAVLDEFRAGKLGRITLEWI